MPHRAFGPTRIHVHPDLYMLHSLYLIRSHCKTILLGQTRGIDTATEMQDLQKTELEPNAYQNEIRFMCGSVTLYILYKDSDPCVGKFEGL